jgi:hypothetical protein
MLSPCEQIRSSGVSPWTYQGKYPVYMLFMLDSLVYKHGGLEAIKAQAEWLQHLIVPAQAKNVQGGKELLRIMFSKQDARFFSQTTRSLSVILGCCDRPAGARSAEPVSTC